MKNLKKVLMLLLFAALLLTVAAQAVFAEGEDAAATVADNAAGIKAIAAGAVLGGVALVGVVGMALVIRKALEGITRQPEASDKVRSAMMLGLVFVETLIIYALVVAIFIIFML